MQRGDAIGQGTLGYEASHLLVHGHDPYVIRVPGAVEQVESGKAIQEEEDLQEAVAPGETEGLGDLSSVVHRSKTQVSFILPPLDILVRCLPGGATRAKEPGTASKI